MQQILDSFLRSFEIVRPEINGRTHCASCILGTRVALEVLARFGIAASPLTVHVVIGNAAYARLAKASRIPTDLDERSRLRVKCGATWFALGGWGPADPGDWAHHLVAIIGGRQLLDMAIDQEWRKGSDFQISPELIPCGEDFLAGRIKLQHIAAPAGCYLEYEALPGESSYEQTHAWRDIGRLVDPVVRAMRHDMSQGPDLYSRWA
jgi:hypothetical protein